jgi:sugar phosphate isomerase/epimerase
MLGIQLYTVRDKMFDRESARDTLIKIKEMGYECVQLASSIENMEFTAEICKDIGLPAVGLLCNIDMCEEDGEKLFEIANICGAKDIGISSGMKTEEDARDVITRANAFAKKAHDNGFTFSYHNHSNEFIRGKNGKTLMQFLLEEFDSQLVDFMPDTYWLQHGGTDVRDFIEKLGDRVKILHLKDMKRTVDGPTYAEIGVGNINFKGIADVAKNIGVEHFIVEQDKCDIDSLISAKISYDYLTTQIF